MRKGYLMQSVAGYVLLLLAINASGQHREAGTTAFDMLRMSYDARDIAMAGASTAMASGVYGFHTNPAAMGYNEGKQAAIAYRWVILDVQGAMLAFGLPLKHYGFWSIGIINLSEGTVDEVAMDLYNTPYETGRVWRTNGIAGNLSWSKIIWKTLSLGATVKGIYHYMGTEGEHYSANGFALDIGLQYRLAKSRFIMGAALRNFGIMSNSYTENLDRYPLPLGVGVGLSYQPRHLPRLRIALDIEQERNDFLEVEPGLEIALIEKILFVRLGYAFSDRDLSHAISTLQGEADDGYMKSNWSTLCLGFGINAPVRNIGVGIDCGLEFRADIQQPSVVVSALVSF